MMQAADLHRAWHALPVADIDTIFGTGRILVLAPHADDESLGCGGLIATCCRRSRPPLVVVLTDGTGSHPAIPATELRRTRELEAMAALQELGLDEPGSLVFLGLPDTKAPHAGPQFEAAAAEIARLAAGCVAICAPWRHDPHCDHLAADLLAREASARANIRHISYPVWGWNLPPHDMIDQDEGGGWRLDIGAVMAEKERAIAAHRSQHGALARQDPDGFRLPEDLLGIFRRPYEVFLSP
jgi:LmbE family N-acetylglucosaminyl deacetylase